MYNWSTDTRTLEENLDTWNIWRLEQLINYGLNGEKIDKKLLNKYWLRLRLDPKRRNLLAFWLWKKQS